MKGKYSKLIQEFCEKEGVYVPPGFKRLSASHIALIRNDSGEQKLVAKTFFKKEDVNYYISSVLSELTPNSDGNLPIRVVDFKEKLEFIVSSNGSLVQL